MRRLLLLAGVVGCGGGDVGTSPLSVADLLGTDGLHVEFAPLEEPEAQPWLLRLDGAEWEGRDGDDWGASEVLGTWTRDTSDGLQVDEGQGPTRLLPDRVDVGTKADGVEVIAIGETETWYGVFERTVEVEVAEGRWAGRQVFAQDVGLVVWTLDGEERGLVYYE